MARTQVQSELLAVNSISGTIIADNAITATHIATNAISGTLVQDGGIVTVMIAANNVTATKIVTDAVQTRHIADDQVTAAKLANSINTDIATGPAALPKAGGTMTGTIASFRSTGIDDNADALAITIDSSENVGIGTTTPSTGFNTNRNNVVVSDNSGAVGITINSVDTTGSSILSFTDGSGGTLAGEIHYVHDGDTMRFNTGTAERMRIGSSGKTSWSANGVGNVATQDRDFTFYTEGSTNGVAIHSAANRIVFMGGAGSSGTGSDKGYLQLEAEGTATVVFNSAGDSYFNGGDVGIGITDPTVDLHIKRADGTGLVLESSNDQNNTGDRIAMEFRTDGSQGIAKIIGGKEGNYQGQSVRSGYLAFQTIEANTYAERMRLKANGALQLQSSASTSNRMEEVFHTANVGTSYTDFFSVDIASAHRAVFYEIITFGGDWSGHSAARSYYKGFMSGTTSYSGDGEMENAGTYGSGSHIDWNYTRSGSTVTFQVKLYSGSVALEAYIRVIGTFGNITLL